MKAKIYQPAKNAMQSGKSGAQKKWVVELQENESPRKINQLMGWVSVDDTLSELHFSFASKDEAINFAKLSRFEYEVIEPKLPTLKKKSYAENFC